MLEAKLRAIGWLKSSYCMKKVDFRDFFEVIVHFCFLLKVISWSEGYGLLVKKKKKKVIEQFTSITEIVCCCSFFKLR